MADPRFELDHVFVAVAGHADPVAAMLAEHGFSVSESRAHTGQGTASVGVFFENAYLELIWLEDPRAAEQPAISRTGLRQRIDRSHLANPLGVGVRVSETESSEYPFDTWPYAPPYVPQGTAIPIGLNSTRLEEPLLFVLPWKHAPTVMPEPHSNGTRTVTAVTVVHPDTPAPSKELQSLMALGPIDIVDGPSPLLSVTLDAERQQQQLDCRPEADLVLRW